MSLGLCSVQQTLPVRDILLYTALPMKNFGALLSLGVLCSGEMANVPILSVFIPSFLFIRTFWACLTRWIVRNVQMEENADGVIAHHLFWDSSGMDVERLRYCHFCL